MWLFIKTKNLYAPIMYPFMHGAKQVPKFIRLQFHRHWNHTWIHGSKDVAKCVHRWFHLYWNPNWIQGGCKMYPSAVPLALEPELDPRRLGIHRWFHCHWNHTWDPCIQVLCTMYPQQLNWQWSHFWLHESKDIINSTHTFCIGNGSNFGYMYPKRFQHVSISGSITIGTTVGSMDTFVAQSTKIHESHSSYFYLNNTIINVFDAYK